MVERADLPGILVISKRSRSGRQYSLFFLISAPMWFIKLDCRTETTSMYQELAGCMGTDTGHHLSEQWELSKRPGLRKYLPTRGIHCHDDEDPAAMIHTDSKWKQTQAQMQLLLSLLLHCLLTRHERYTSRERSLQARILTILPLYTIPPSCSFFFHPPSPSILTTTLPDDVTLNIRPYATDHG